MASVNEELEDEICNTESLKQVPIPFRCPFFIHWLKLIHFVGLSLLFNLIDCCEESIGKDRHDEVASKE